MKRKGIYSLFLLFLMVVANANAQSIAVLWTEDPPTSNGIMERENVDNNYWITNVSSPMLDIYLPDALSNTGMAVVICPGGGYAGLAYMNEGIQMAKWLAQKGIAAFVLKYRMPNEHKEVPLDDAWQAMRFVRENAADYKINPSRVGIMGFSAGGHLASTASTRFAEKGTITRPDFCVLFYPVITMGDGTHTGSRDKLLGLDPSQEDINMFSNEKQVRSNTPPTIMFLSDDDDLVPPSNSINYYNALKRRKISASMYIFPEGGHGWGMRSDFRYKKQMLDLLSEWLLDVNVKLN